MHAWGTIPVNATDATGDARLYDPAVGNTTFNGRVAGQHIVFEDYDGDGRDDTPMDVHAEAGMGCIDCHGSRDLHGGVEGDPTSGRIQSRQNQSTAIRCTSCHGGAEARSPTVACTTYDGRQAMCATDSEGNPLKHVSADPEGNYWLVSRLDGQRHYIPQTYDVVVDSGRLNPITSRAIFNPRASYAMGRADGNPHQPPQRQRQ